MDGYSALDRRSVAPARWLIGMIGGDISEAATGLMFYNTYTALYDNARTDPI